MASYREVIRVSVFQFVAGTKQPGDVLNGKVRHVFRDGRAVDALQVVDGQHALHHRGVGRQHKVVLVHACGVVALGFQDAHDAQRNRVEADDAPDGVLAVRKERVGHGLSDDAHLGSRLDVLVGEHFAVVDFQLPDFHVSGADAVEGGRRVVVSADELS